MSFWKWSKTAATNDDVDSTVNLQEGQSPSSLNDSVRAIMAALAKYRDDISGNLVAGGTSTAMTVTTNQVLTSLTDGFMLRIRMTETSGATPTLNVDSLGAKPIQSVSGTAIPTGALLDNGVYTFVYDSDADAWIVVDRYADMMLTTSNPDLVAIEAISANTGVLRKTAANTWSLDDGTTSLIFIKDNDGIELEDGILGDIRVPFAATITGVTLLADQSGSCVVDIWKDTYANYPPTDADSITASAPPTISGATKSDDTTLSGWTTSITPGDILRFNLDSVSSITRIEIYVRVRRYI